MAVTNNLWLDSKYQIFIRYFIDCKLQSKPDMTPTDSADLIHGGGGGGGEGNIFFDIIVDLNGTEFSIIF